MFNVGGYKIAMGNSPAEFKTQADLIAPTNDEGGLAWALRKILKFKREKQ
jgi:hydroxymethylpyrimidine pyrophosphatase-like HAD family hydrolase